LAPDGRSAYVPIENKSSIAQYGIGGDGRLAPKQPASAAAPFNQTAIAVSPDGRNAYVTVRATTSSSPGEVAQYTIGAGGTLTPKSPATLPTGRGPWAIAVTPDGRNAYVANVYSDDVSQYTIGAGGTLTPKSPATVPAGRQPTGIAVAPEGGEAYVTNSGISRDTSSVSQYTIGADGRLSPKTPANVPTGFHPTAIAVSPDGDEAYVANQLSDSISQYTVTTTGRLAPKGPAAVPAGSRPSAIALNPDGRSAYALNYASRDISQYSIGADGLLTPQDPATVGAGRAPVAIAVRAVPPSSADEFRLGRVNRNERTGTARLNVTVRRRGRVVLTGKRVRRVAKRPHRARKLSLAVAPRRKAKRRLRRTGRARARVAVSFTPRGAAEATKHRTVTLVRR
jgi:DNA-binding beta-propeller fold protein YncE